MAPQTITAVSPNKPSKSKKNNQPTNQPQKLRSRKSKNENKTSNKSNSKERSTERLDSVRDVTGGIGYFPTKFNPSINQSIYKNVLLSPVTSWIIGGFSVIFHFYALYYLYQKYEEIKQYADGHVPDYVILAFPFFAVTVIAELIYDRFYNLGLYRTNDALSSISSGSVMLLTKKLMNQYFGFFPYAWVYDNFSVKHWLFESGSISWWAVFVGVDFAYYWVHRTGHTMNLFWAMHGVHHAGEEYNLTTALRQSVLHGVFNWVFYIPLAFFFPPKLFLLHSQFNLLYQFWIHTQVIRKLGPLEYILNTPSQHRVHHGRNSYCIDKNYGGTLSIFDRLFGTFQEEMEEVPICYGLTHSIHTFEAHTPNVKLLGNIYQSMCKIPNFFEKFLAFWYGPGWIPGTYPPKEYPIPPITRHTHQKFNTKHSTGLKAYIVSEFLVVLILVTVVAGYPSDGVFIGFMTILNVYLLFSLYTFGCLIDRAHGALSLEILRLAVGAGFISYASSSLFPDSETFGIVGLFVMFVSAFTIFQFKEELNTPWGSDEIGIDYPESEVEEKKQLAMKKKN